MDSAYDHIQEENYPRAATPQPQGQDSSDSSKPAPNDFNSEIQDAYKAISSSPWATRLGGFLGSVKKQGEQYYENASKNLPAATSNASAGLSSLISHTRSLSVRTGEASASTSTSTSKDDPSSTDNEPSSAHPDRPESLPADIIKEVGSVVSRFRSEAAKRLKDVEKAEDAADEALLKFGTNIRNFLRDAVTIAPPSSPGADGQPSGKVLFESKDSEGKRVIHTTRADAQLHVIHSSLDSFLRDPASPEWEDWHKDFDVEKKTDAISKDLEKHEELRRAMEKLVPEKVEYKEFWGRYYFLRYVVESEEQRRKEMLKASAPTDDEPSWDEDSEDEEASTPHRANPTSPTNLAASVGTLKPAADDSLKPTPPTTRRSNDEKSVADSDASYDLVSGATSQAPGSPQDKKKETVAEESDEEDWE